MNKQKAKEQLIEKSFFCKDKNIHFGALHVIYIRDAIEILDKLEEQGK